MAAAPDDARQSRTREVLILGAFLLICAAGAFSVLLPETRNDRDDLDRENAPATAQDVNSVAPTAAPAPAQ